MGSVPVGSANWVSPWVQLKYFTYHPAVYPRMLGAVSRDATPGCIVNVYDKNGEHFGCGFWNPVSRTPLRMFYHGPEIVHEAYLLSALRRAVEWRKAWIRADTTAYRVVHGDSDGLGGLVVDQYADVLSVEVSVLGVWQRLGKWLPTLHALCGTRRHVINVAVDAVRTEGIDPASDMPPCEPVRRVRILEHGVNFDVDFSRGHKTGFFCDQRENRLKLAGLLKGKTLLDLCCYTGGFSIYAKLFGGAGEVTAVDLDEDAVAMAKRNAAINSRSGPLRIDFVHADAFTYTRQMIRNGRQFDAVLLDPPKLLLSRDVSVREEGIKKYRDLNALGMQCVHPGGLFVTCSCSGLLSASDFEQLVIHTAQHLGIRLQIFDVTGPGWDHPFLSTYPEGRYLKVIWTRVVA